MSHISPASRNTKKFSTQLLFFQEDFKYSKSSLLFITEVGIKGFWIWLSPLRLCSIRRLPLTCNQCSIICAYYMITYDYISLCYSWILNVTFVDKKAHIVHYATLLPIVKIKNVRMSIFEQKIIKRYSNLVSLNSVFKDATICS